MRKGLRGLIGGVVYVMTESVSVLSDGRLRLAALLSRPWILCGPPLPPTARKRGLKDSVEIRYGYRTK